MPQGLPARPWSLYPRSTRSPVLKLIKEPPPLPLARATYCDVCTECLAHSKLTTSTSSPPPPPAVVALLLLYCCSSFHSIAHSVEILTCMPLLSCLNRLLLRRLWLAIRDQIGHSCRTV